MKPAALLERLLKGVVTNVEFADARRLVEALGFRERRITGSHHIFGHPRLPEQINLQNSRSQAKPYQLRQLVVLVRRYDLSIEEQK
jgi:predicted RNA binding protein YcfA (HicA-like mRNA interferase family)